MSLRSPDYDDPDMDFNEEEPQEDSDSGLPYKTPEQLADAMRQTIAAKKQKNEANQNLANFKKCLQK